MNSLRFFHALNDFNPFYPILSECWVSSRTFYFTLVDICGHWCFFAFQDSVITHMSLSLKYLVLCKSRFKKLKKWVRSPVFSFCASFSFILRKHKISRTKRNKISYYLQFNFLLQCCKFQCMYFYLLNEEKDKCQGSQQDLFLKSKIALIAWKYLAIYVITSNCCSSS